MNTPTYLLPSKGESLFLRDHTFKFPLAHTPGGGVGEADEEKRVTVGIRSYPF